MKKYIPLLLPVVLLTGCSLSSAEKYGFRQVKPKDAMIQMEEESDYVILDVRRPDEFQEGHIVGAINIPNETIGKESIQELPNKNQLIFVYCRSGVRSKQASQKLAAQGYTNIVEFGGILDWPGETVSE